ncbi:MAG: DUF1697 domain-containing protein [Pseudoxanthomonas sp.]
MRAINAVGTGTLVKADLRRLCEAIGFAEMRTRIASGKTVFRSTSAAVQAKTAPDDALAVHAGKPVAVLVRAGAELATVLAGNPFPDAAPNPAVTIFLGTAPAAESIELARHLSRSRGP